MDDENDAEVDLSPWLIRFGKMRSMMTISIKKNNSGFAKCSLCNKAKHMRMTEKEGVIVYTRTQEENDVLAWMNIKVRLITQSQLTILKAAECTA